MDYQIFQFFNNLAGNFEWIDDIGIFLAAYLQYFIGAGIIVWMFVSRGQFDFWRKTKITAYFFGTAIISRFFFGEILKRLISRPRPFDEHQVTQFILEDPHTSFPSGHVSFFFAFSTAVYFYNKKAGTICFVASFLMGLARIYTGVHYPLDILGGMVLGFLTGWGSWKFFQRRFSLSFPLSRE